jgi:glucose-6-phosphate 1-epimerase
MEIELKCGSIKAIVDSQGAYLLSLSDNTGDILFPKKELKALDGAVKQRGGCHVCLPNFGPGGTSGQPQHGFGRMAVWEVGDRTDDSILRVLREGTGGYHDMESIVTYQLSEGTLTMTLEVVNHGESVLRVAPAFHPYFATNGDVPIKLNGKDQKLGHLAEAIFFEGNEHVLKLPSRTFTLMSEALPMWVKWTDQLGEYICIEPSQNGFSFLKDIPDTAELLEAGASKVYSMCMTWN